MAGVRAGGDRQELHERIRQHSLAAAQQVKEHGRPNDLIDRLRKDLAFKGIDVERVLNPSAFVGRAPQQVEHFVRTQVEPVRSRYRQQVQQGVQLRV